MEGPLLSVPAVSAYVGLGRAALVVGVLSIGGCQVAPHDTAPSDPVDFVSAYGITPGPMAGDAGATRPGDAGHRQDAAVDAHPHARDAGRAVDAGRPARPPVHAPEGTMVPLYGIAPP